MKKLFFILVVLLPSIFVKAQDSTSIEAPRRTHQYFISTNSGLQNTPVGFRIGMLDKMGGYVGARFGKGNKYKENQFTNEVEVKEATLFAVNAGLIFPISIRNAFKVRTYLGIGYGKWFDRLSKNGQTVGFDSEVGLMLSYQRFMLSFGGNLLTGDGNSPRKDLTLGVGLIF